MSVPQRGVTNPEELEHAPGRERENLEGWIPELASGEEIRAALEKAFDFRGDVTLTLKSGEKVEGYIFDRRTGLSLTDSIGRLYSKTGNQKISISYADIAALAFTGRDTAAGKSWEAWMKKYNEKKAAGEKNIALEPESLEQCGAADDAVRRGSGTPREGKHRGTIPDECVRGSTFT